jgi:hypothetical protein
MASLMAHDSAGATMSTVSGQDARTGAFCPVCGVGRRGQARYCESCGHQFADAATTELGTAPPAVSAPPPSAARKRNALPWLPIAGVLALLAAAAVIAVLLLGEGEKSTGYQQQVAAQVAKVTAADNALADELDRLRPSGESSSTLAAATTAATATHDTQVALDVLTTPSDKQSLHAATDAALASQAAYLGGVAAALRSPSTAAASDLTPLAVDARDQWAGLSVFIAEAGGRITGYDKLAAWARAKAGSSTGQSGGTSGKTTGTTTSANLALSSYVAAVENVLAYARPGFDRINQVYTGMKAGTISWEAARAGLDYVLTNRQDALARANSLDAPTTAAADVKRLLAAALEASLINDRDILAAFNSYATEDVQSFYNSQVIASASSSAASSAKRSFLNAYNRLRGAAGLGDTQFESF